MAASGCTGWWVIILCCCTINANRKQSLVPLNSKENLNTIKEELAAIWEPLVETHFENQINIKLSTPFLNVNAFQHALSLDLYKVAHQHYLNEWKLVNRPLASTQVAPFNHGGPHGWLWIDAEAKACCLGEGGQQWEGWPLFNFLYISWFGLAILYGSRRNGGWFYTMMILL